MFLYNKQLCPLWPGNFFGQEIFISKNKKFLLKIYDSLSYDYDIKSYFFEELEIIMKRQILANAELAIMDLLWRNEKLTARQIREQLYPNATKAQHGTVQRLLQRLEDKGYVERDRSLSVHLFSAAISRQTYAGQQLESLADRLTDGSFAPLITHLVEKKKISRKEINRIHDILDGKIDEGEQA